MDASHYSEVLSFLKSRTAKPNWTSEQRQFYKRTYSVDKKGNLCDARTGDRVSLLEEQVPQIYKDTLSTNGSTMPPISPKYGSIKISNGNNNKISTSLSVLQRYRSVNNMSPMEMYRSRSRSPAASEYKLSASSSEKDVNNEREKPFVYQPMAKSRTRLESELLDSQKERERNYVYQPRAISRSRYESEDKDIMSDSQRLKGDILEGDRLTRFQSEERDDRDERESSVGSLSVSFRSSTPSSFSQNGKYATPEEEVDALRSLLRQQQRQIKDQESKTRQLQSTLQMALESKIAGEEIAIKRRDESEAEIKQLKETIRNAKDTALTDCKRQLANVQGKLLAAEVELDNEAKRHSDAFRKSQNELLLTRADVLTANDELEQRRIAHEKETEKLRKAETELKAQSEQITRLEAFVAQLKVKLSLNIQTVVEKEAKMTALDAKLATQKTFIQELLAKIAAKDSAIQIMRKKLFDAMQLLPEDLEAPRKLRTIFETEMEGALPDIVVTLKNGTYYEDNQRRSRAKMEAALRLCEDIDALETSNNQLLQEYEEAIGENGDEIATSPTTDKSECSSPIRKLENVDFAQPVTFIDNSNEFLLEPKKECSENETETGTSLVEKSDEAAGAETEAAPVPCGPTMFNPIPKRRKSSSHRSSRSNSIVSSTDNEINLIVRETNEFSVPSEEEINAAVVANELANTIASAEEIANTKVDDMKKEITTDPSAKDIELAKSMKKLESLRQRLSQRAAEKSPKPVQNGAEVQDDAKDSENAQSIRSVRFSDDDE